VKRVSIILVLGIAVGLLFCGGEEEIVETIDAAVDVAPVLPKKYCGDGICDEDREDFLVCPLDCLPYCGDGICSNGENKWTCWTDCQPHLGINPNIFDRPDRDIFDPPGD
jgi:hypothetical protein